MEEELRLLLLGLGAGGVAAAVNRRVMKAAAFGYVALTEGLGNPQARASVLDCLTG